MLLHLKDVAADRGQIRHRVGTDKIGAPEMIRCARDLGLKARAWRTKWSRLVRTPLPAIASLPARGGGGRLLHDLDHRERVWVIGQPVVHA